jgi:DNA-binding SARP family transcriptional activator
VTEDANSSLEFQMLGPIAVYRDGQPVLIEGTRRRSLLALLLAAHGRAVPQTTLVDAVWEEADLADPSGSLQVALSFLRRLLNDPADASDAWIRRVGQGYALIADDDACDSWRFARLRQNGRDADQAGDRTAASAAYAQALAEWTGEALQDLRGVRFADDLAAGLDEARLATVEAKVEADLARGAHRDAVETAAEYATANPTREGLHLSWMLALYRDGRQGDALAVYARLRGALLETLGVEPGQAAQRLQAAILRQDPALDVADGPRLVSTPGRPNRGATTTLVGVSTSHGGQLVDELGGVFTLTGNRVTIGREPDNDLVVPTARTSRHHAVLTLTPLGWLVGDQHSSNGTLLNSEPIETELLRDGDLLNIGGMLYRFVL